MVQWTANGVALCTTSSYNYSGLIAPTITSDGAGGAIVAWGDYRNRGADFYAQRISAAGEVQWTANGVSISTDTNGQGVAIASDGAGGAIIAWGANPLDIDGDRAFAQRVSATGAVLWAVGGVLLSTDMWGRKLPTIVSDGAGGAIVSWCDEDACAQRISATGTLLWTTAGVRLGRSSYINGHSPRIASDGTGGAIVTWYDRRDGVPPVIYAQRISADGTVQWTANGVALCTPTYRDQRCPTIVSDGAGGAIVAWRDNRELSIYFDIYAQRISAEGTVQWGGDGVALTAPGNQGYIYQYPPITSDGAGGAIVAWGDCRNGNWDIYAQNVKANGQLGGDVPTPVLLSFVSVETDADGIQLTWLAGGSMSAVATVYRSAVGGEWTRVAEITADGTGYLRYTDPIDATATRVGYRLGIVEAGVEGFYGETWVDLPTGEASLAFALDPVRPNPSRGGTLTVRFSLPTNAPARLDLLDVAGRRIASHDVGMGQHTLDLGAGQHLAPGLYLVRLTQGANTRTTRVAVIR